MIDQEDADLLRDSAKGFLADKAPVAQLRKLRDTGAEYDEGTWGEMADMGWTGVLISEDHGGINMGATAAGILAEEMGRTLAASPWFSSCVLGATALEQAGSHAQKEAWLPALATGTKTLALALDEGRYHDPHATAMAATRKGNGFELNGTKTFVLGGPAADAFIVAARTCGSPGDEGGITLFLVAKDAAGLDVERTALVDSRQAARLTFEAVEVTADAVLGEVDEGAAPLGVVLNTGRAVLAAEMLGSGKESFARTRQYLTEREQFGVPIGSFQALQHRAAHLWSELELLDAVVAKALHDLDTDDPGAELTCALAKAKAGDVTRLATREAVQMHGGIGMTDDHEIGFFLKRIRAASATLGDTSFHLDRFARLRGF